MVLHGPLVQYECAYVFTCSLDLSVILRGVVAGQLR